MTSAPASEPISWEQASANRSGTFGGCSSSEDLDGAGPSRWQIERALMPCGLPAKRVWWFA